MRFIRIFLIVASFFTSSASAGLAKALMPIVEKNIICKVWVTFKDKKSDDKTLISSKASLRRQKVNYHENETDLNVSESYIQGVESCGAKLHHIFKWENSASFILRSNSLEKIASLSYVNSVSPVGICTQHFKKNTDNLQKRKTVTDQALYGYSYDQLNLVNVPSAHNYLLEERKFAAPGENVLIAFFDSGFRLNHNCLRMIQQGHIKATYDFIDNDLSVSDPDSVVKNSKHPYYHNDEHGSEVLSLVAGYDPGKFMGVAWGAQFALARTENTFLKEDTIITKDMISDTVYQMDTTINSYEVEIHSEEDDWAAAVVWAESLGVDIISSSLGYRDGFQDTAVLSSGDTVRRVIDYSYNDLDGKTTLVSRAAMGAVQRGIIVVNAIGNEGSSVSGTLVAPADVDGVIAVGALDASGTGISYFSSTGPTSDGRIKPDLVVQGSSVTVPVIYGDPSMYNMQNGTSFAAPVVAGICALIVQSLGKESLGYSSNNVKDLLFNSCKFLPEQVTFDNVYGRGLPDALKACRTTLESSVVLGVYPNVIKPGATRKITFFSNLKENDLKVNLRVLSVDGNLIWKKSSILNASDPVITIWECKNSSGKNIVPGIYFVFLDCKGKTYKNKILISG